ncbi:hypothetical protein CLV69_101485 [Amycolatopsis arida]|nr:hypothetical protein CLV69_101485 [Amycolatopsis arida]
MRGCYSVALRQCTVFVMGVGGDGRATDRFI